MSKNQLREWMAKTGTTQAALAKALGVTQPHVSRLISGQRPLCDLRVAVKLAEITGIQVSALAKLNRTAA